MPDALIFSATGNVDEFTFAKVSNRGLLMGVLMCLDVSTSGVPSSPRTMGLSKIFAVLVALDRGVAAPSYPSSVPASNLKESYHFTL